MQVNDSVSWLELASTLCAASAVAYKAAFMLAANAGEEREYLDHCTARYALLEGLLADLHGSLGPAQLRDLLTRLDADPSCYADRDHALAAAMANDRELNRVLAEATSLSSMAVGAQPIMLSSTLGRVIMPGHAGRQRPATPALRCRCRVWPRWRRAQRPRLGARTPNSSRRDAISRQACSTGSAPGETG